MSTTNALNTLFIERAKADGMEKTAEQLTTYLRDKLRQDGVARRVIAPVSITDTDLERSVSDSIPRVVIDKEPDSTAFVMNFRDEGELNFFTNDKYEAKFFKVETEHFKRTEIELAVTRMPIEDVLKTNSIYDMQKMEDTVFNRLLDESAAAADVANTIAQAGGRLDLDAVAGMAEQQTKTLARPHTFICSEARWIDILRLTNVEMGSPIQSEVIVDGYKYNTLGGYKFVTSINTDVWTHTEAWCLPSPQFLGSFFLYGDARHCVEHRGDVFEFWAYSYPAMAIGNINHVVKATGFAA